MKKRLYLDTSVLGGCFDKEFFSWSNALIEQIKTHKKLFVVSDLTLKELEDAPLCVRNLFEEIPAISKEYVILTNESEELAQKYIKEKAITQKYFVDAQHIAIATLHNVDCLVSWNFKHIVNLYKIRLYNAVNMKYGYPLIEIRTPMEVLNEN